MCISSIIPEIWHICPQLKNNNSHFSNLVEYNLCDPFEAYRIPNVHQILNVVKESYCWQLLLITCSVLLFVFCMYHQQFCTQLSGSRPVRAVTITMVTAGSIV